jgi:hypothetical protein
MHDRHKSYADMLARGKKWAALASENLSQTECDKLAMQLDALVVSTVSMNQKLTARDAAAKLVKNPARKTKSTSQADSRHKSANEATSTKKKGSKRKRQTPSLTATT